MPSSAENRRPVRIAGKPPERLRSKRIRVLIAAALAIPLMLGGAYLAVDRLQSSDALDHPAHPLDDNQSKGQVVDPVKDIVSLAQLQASSAGYMLMSCTNQNEPPYQGAIYLTFSLPTDTQPATYFGAIAATLVGHGWTEGLPPNNHAFANSFVRDGVTVIIYRQDDDPGRGVLRAHGECRNTNDHRADTTAWIDITDQFARAR
ncbi:MAG: hypothetical protein JOZ00_09575 [Mycobacterium sp.]|uniref:hypothetical protein n=1 Tax=Mycobacterium sp. TaxID=1785 RepID=UPI001EBCBD75|nr:hypothetical protein [Mycobacterium sp.]MBV8786925.1 hypothetical protein [Mycobacterium sp.]